MRFLLNGVFELSVEQGGNDNRLVSNHASALPHQTEELFQFSNHYEDGSDNLNFEDADSLRQWQFASEPANVYDSRLSNLIIQPDTTGNALYLSGTGLLFGNWFGWTDNPWL